MGLFELWASAEVSSDLKHHEHDCHVDVLGAVGMAAGNTSYLAVYRVKYLNDARSYREALDQFTFWTRKELIKRHSNLNYVRLSKETLHVWLDDVCPSCHGLKYQLMPHTPILTDKECPQCKGTGQRTLTGEKQKVQIMLEVTGKADRIMNYLKVEIAKKLK